MKRFTLTGCLFAFALATSAQAGQFYKWKNADGVDQYTDTAPPAWH